MEECDINSFNSICDVVSKVCVFVCRNKEVLLVGLIVH